MNVCSPRLLDKGGREGEKVKDSPGQVHAVPEVPEVLEDESSNTSNQSSTLSPRDATASNIAKTRKKAMTRLRV